MTDKIFYINISNNIEVVLDYRFKIKGFEEFIRLSFDKLEINKDEYKIYFDKDNIKNHKMLINIIINLYKKHKGVDDIIKRLKVDYKKNIIIKIYKYQLSFDKDAIYISIYKISSKEFKIDFSSKKEIVFNYIKGLFLFDILDISERYMIVSLNNDTKQIIEALTSRNTIMGYKVFFKVDEKEFLYNNRKFSVEGSLKEYLTKVRNALEVFNVSTIYEFDKIKKEYRKLAKKYHPDMHRDKPELIQKIYTKKFHKIKDSFEILKEYYDFKLKN